MPRVSKGTRTNRKTKRENLPTKFRPGFVGSLDGRSLIARALRKRFEQIATDLGGQSDLSALKSSLLERLVWLEAMLCKIESDLGATTDAKATAEILSRWIQAINSFTGIAKTLGLERTVRDPWAALDITRDSPVPAPHAEEVPTDGHPSP
jgi:hypothetical protein